MITRTFEFSGGLQTFAVPTGVTKLTVELWGGQGDQRYQVAGANERGAGGYVKADINVTAGSTLNVYVGGMGGTTAGGYGGASGGAGGTSAGLSGGGGGGSSEIRSGATRILVAGGGGGGAWPMTDNAISSPTYGGHGGGSTGASGSYASPGGGAGQGGSQTTGGNGGAGEGGSSTPGTPGTSSVGGTGGNGGQYSCGAGGGGGGYYSGGGGGGGHSTTIANHNAGGGGGGSSYTGHSSVIAGTVVSLQGSRQGNGRIVISHVESPPSVPTNITPAAGAVLNVDDPTLTARFTTSATQTRSRVQWQIASDSGFTQNLRTYTMPESQLQNGGLSGVAVSYKIGSTAGDQRLSQGTWYIRARSIDANNSASDFSGAQSFRVEFPPTTLNHFPTGNLAVQHNATGVMLAWDFISISPNVSQSAYQVVVEQNNGVQIADTGKVTTSTESTTVIIPIALKGAQLRWRVRVWDSDNVMGPYSDYHLFRTADLPVVAISAMTTVVTANPTVFFNVTPAGGAAIIQKRLYITRDSDDAIVYDSGWV